MRRLHIAAAIAAALLAGTALAVTPEAKTERDAVATAKTEYIAARDQAKKNYAATKTACMRLTVENRATCIDQAKAFRQRALAEARTAYNIEVARAKTSTSTKGA